MIWLTIILLTLYVGGAYSLLSLQPEEVKVVPSLEGISFSIVVPVRNEEGNITALLTSICEQQGEYEVIVVNDHSDDGTVQEVNSFIENNLDVSVQLLHLNEEALSPKKSAITLAVKEAKGNIILTTDGDCIVPENWLSVIASKFQDKETQMVLGGVRYAPITNLFEEIQAHELSALLTVSMLRAKVNKPFTCNGANLAYRKSAFFAVDGFADVDQIASGDDELLMKKIFAKYPKGIAVQEEAFVNTLPNKTVKQLFNQRIRWASKWKYGSWKDKIPGAFLMLLYLSVLAIPFSYTQKDVLPFLIVGVLLGLKYYVDKLMIEKTLGKRERKFVSTFFLFFIYPIYVVFFGLSATFLKFSWKGRQLK